MSDNVLDFEARKQAQLLKRKDASVDALRKAFKLARGDAGPDKPAGSTSAQGKARTRSKKK